MSAGSGASNLGYGNITPLSNVNNNFVNVHNTNNPSNFSSNQIPGTNGLPGLSGSKNNVDAASGYISNMRFKGGAKSFKEKIKNITKKYKMKSKKTIRKLKNTLRKKYNSKKSSLNKTLRRRKYQTKMRKYRGGSNIPNYPTGYGQYMNNMPNTPTYSLGGRLDSSQLGLANPPPYKALSNCTNCVDNYNHFTNSGFSSRGN